MSMGDNILWKNTKQAGKALQSLSQVVKERGHLSKDMDKARESNGEVRSSTDEGDKE